jgi:hypothetical protein
MAAGKIRHWKHGWIPISAAAKAFVEGRGPRPDSKDDTPAARLAASRLKNSDRDAAREARLAAQQARYNAAFNKKLAAGKVGPVGMDWKNMSPEQKIKATEIMYGTGSPQHLQAIKKFRK